MLTKRISLHCMLVSLGVWPTLVKNCDMHIPSFFHRTCQMFLNSTAARRNNRAKCDKNINIGRSVVYDRPLCRFIFICRHNVTFISTRVNINKRLTAIEI